MEQAIEFIMAFYQIPRETAIKLYWDEIESYMWLIAEQQSKLSN